MPVYRIPYKSKPRSIPWPAQATGSVEKLEDIPALVGAYTPENMRGFSGFATLARIAHSLVKQDGTLFYADEIATITHNHTNKPVLDDLSQIGNQLGYKGEIVGGTAPLYTEYTGGGVNAVDSIPTVNLSNRVIQTLVEGQLHFWSLDVIEPPPAEDPDGGVIRPDDFHAIDNPKVWLMRL